MGRKYFVNTLASTLAYSRSCYLTTGANVEQCSIFATQHLPFNITHNISCPFEDYMCKAAANGAISLDTRFLDSHEVFGINSRPEDRVQVWKRTTCSPITTQGFWALRNCSILYQTPGKSPLPLEQCIYWAYGRSLEDSPLNLLENETFTNSLYASNRTESYTML